jgi:hypothetical protein
MGPPGRARRGRLVAAALAGMALGFGCAVLGVGRAWTVPVRELDAEGAARFRIRNLKPGDTAEAVRAALGEPADRMPTCILDQVAWRYPIREWNEKHEAMTAVPAVVLRARFDSSGTLVEWGFVHPGDGRPLAVVESASDALRWYRALSPPPVPPLVELDKVLARGRSSRADVERELGRWRPDLRCGNGGPAPTVRSRTDESGSVQEWYVDRPSPLFVPPQYLIVIFDSGSRLVGCHIEQTYPGGRK